MNRWIAHGAARDKLLLGIPFYGRTFTVLSPSQTNMGDLDTGLGGAGIYTQERGFLSYYEVTRTFVQTIRNEYVVHVTLLQRSGD